MDKDLKALRNARWDKAFKKNGNSSKDDSSTDLHENYKDAVNRKATIVIEHIIQASDVSHTMQVGTHDSTMSVSGSHLLYFSSSALACVSQMESQVVYGDVPCL